MIAVENARLSLGGRSLFEDLSLQLSPGEKTVLSGESGTGKSTLLRVLIGRQKLDSGTVRIADLSLSPKHIAEIRKKMFYLPQDIRPVGEETVRDFLEEPFQYAVNRGRRLNLDAAEALLVRMRLRPEAMRERFDALSGGERKRVGVIRCLLMGRSILLLDEPTAGVDERNRDVLVEAILSLTDTTILAVSHDNVFGERAGRRLRLANGRIGEEA